MANCLPTGFGAPSGSSSDVFKSTAPQGAPSEPPSIGRVGSLRSVATVPVTNANGIAVSEALGIVVVSITSHCTLAVYGLREGYPLMHAYGDRGNRTNQFNFYGMGSWIGFTAFHTLLVPEYDNGRVQEVDVLAKRHIRMLGVGELQGPTGVAVHENIIAVTEGKAHRVTIMDLITGDIVRRISGQGTAPGQLLWPTGVAITQRGTRVAVADLGNNRVSEFGINGEFLQVMGGKDQGINGPADVVETAEGVVVANRGGNNLILLPAGGKAPSVFPSPSTKGGAGNTLVGPIALSSLQNGSLVVLEHGGRCFQVLSKKAKSGDGAAAQPTPAADSSL